MFRKSNTRANRRKRLFNKIIQEAVRTVLAEENDRNDDINTQTFEDIQKNTSTDGRSPYYPTKKNNQGERVHAPNKDNPKGVQDPGGADSAQWAWFDGYLKWAEENQKRTDVVKNTVKIVKKGMVQEMIPDYGSPSEESFAKLYDQGDAIISRQRGRKEKGGDPAKGEQIISSKVQGKLNHPEKVVELFMSLSAEEATDVQAYLLNGKNDDDGDADNVSVSTANVTCEDMMATQTFIDAGQSVAYPLAVSSSFIDYVTGTGKAFDTNGRISVAGNLILDGHHRWSGMYACNPKAKITAVNFEFSNAGSDKAGALQALANMQKAVGTMVEPGKPLPFKSGDPKANILNKSVDEIENSPLMVRQLVEQNMNPDGVGPCCSEKWCNEVLADAACVEGVIAQCRSYGADTEADALQNDPNAETLKQAVIKMVSGNLGKLVDQSNSPIGNQPSDLDRKFMPQLDHATIGAEQGLNAIRRNLAKGEVNVSEAIDLRRWNKLAGLLKD